MDGYGYEQRSERRGGSYSRDGGGNRSHPYTQDRGSSWRSYGSRGGGGSGGGGGDYGGEKSNMFVDQSNVGRIIGKKGSKIRQLEEDSGATIKVYSDQMENGKCKVVLIGDGESRRCAEDLIRGVEESFYNGDSRGGGGGGSYGSRYGGGGGGGYGGRGGRDYDSGSRGRSSTCYQCGKEGHFARDCPEQQSGY